LKIQLNISVGIKGKSYAKGEIVEVDKDMASALILSNKGVEIKSAPKPKKKK